MIYRQRFTPLGWFGAVLFTLGPILAGWAAMEYASASVYNRPPGLLIAVLGISGPIGAILVLIGREHYEATEEIERRTTEIAEAACKEEERRKLVGY